MRSKGIQMSTLDEAAIGAHEMFTSYIRAGFTREEALQIVIALLTNHISEHGEGSDATT